MFRTFYFRNQMNAIRTTKCAVHARDVRVGDRVAASLDGIFIVDQMIFEIVNFDSGTISFRTHDYDAREITMQWARNPDDPIVLINGDMTNRCRYSGSTTKL